MKLSRKNYAIVTLSAVMLSMATVGVLAFDDRANAASNGVELRAPVGCARQFDTRDFKRYTKSAYKTFTSVTKSFSDLEPTAPFGATEEAC